ncbi:acetate uptake transporter [Pontibacter beigongshangensis]|uniref:acetate uptake transporter n=1 Tax=Pontibacter beigongshangensis TaxID=2574733 RepID=UPI0019D501C0|nr:acetate uptake transporter [Pontibacter beigongshangensis]
MSNISNIRVIDSTSNPAPLGLLGFGLTTVLLNLANADFIPLTGMIMGMGIFVGGIAQIFAGLMEWKKNNTFGTVAFTAYGSFWIALVATWVLPKMGLAEPADPVSMGWFLTLWGLFTFGMFIGTFRLSRALQIVFGTLVLLFALLALADFTGSHQVKLLGGYTGIICGLSAIYTCLAQILNEVYGKELLPLGTVQVLLKEKRSLQAH